jgi:hypothetical protein
VVPPLGSYLRLYFDGRKGSSKPELTMMTPRHDDKSNDLYVALGSMGLIGLVATVTILTMMHLADVLGPRIGDMISFNPARKVSPDVDTRITVTPAGGPSTIHCILDVRTMLAYGGSLVIEATQPNPSRSFRVHWAGARTSDGRTDCGTSADFTLSPSDLVTLTVAAAH